MTTEGTGRVTNITPFAGSLFLEIARSGKRTSPKTWHNYCVKIIISLSNSTEMRAIEYYVFTALLTAAKQPSFETMSKFESIQ